MNKILHNKLTIYEIDTFSKELNDYISTAEDVLDIDFSGVNKIDLSAIQLLLSASKSCFKKDVILKLHGLNNENIESLRICGCDKLLGINNEQ